MRIPRLLCLLLLLGGSGALFGQYLQISTQATGAITQVPSGSSVTLTAETVGREVLAPFFLQNTNASGSLTISEIVLSGASEVALINAPAAGTAIPAGGSITFSVRYLPSTPRRVTAQVFVGTAEGGLARSYNFQVIGTVPDLVTSYYLEPSGTPLSLADGGTIQFDSANVSTTKTAVIIVQNRGSGNGALQSIGLPSGADYRLVGNPAVPTELTPGREFRFKVSFTPRAAGASTGVLVLTVSGGNTPTFFLNGQGTTANLSVSYTLSSNNNAVSLVDRGHLAFEATPVNTTATASVVISNRGTGPGTVTAITLAGASFEIAGLPVFPATVEPGSQLGFTVRFSPRSTGTFTGSLRITFSDRAILATLDGSTAPAKFALSYVDPDTGNSIALADGGVVAFPDVAVNGRGNVTVVIRNTGDGGGPVNNISLSGPAVFQLQQLPIFPFTVAASGELRFVVRFSPVERQLYSSVLKIDLPDRSFSLKIEATGIGAQFIYERVTGDSSSEIQPGGTIQFNEVEVNRGSDLVLRIRNGGSSDGQISGFVIGDAMFRVTDAPFTPYLLHPGDSVQITLTFTPTTPGVLSARARIGDDSFTLSGTGLGHRLEYSYASNESSSTIEAGGSIFFSPVAVGEQSSGRLTLRNTGNRAAPLFAVSLLSEGAGQSAFRLDGVPALPFNLEPDSALSLEIRFAPNNLGTLSAGLAINGVSFPLVGTGLTPSKLPQYQFEGASGKQDPLQQPSIGLNLLEPYPLPLTGTLNLDFVSDVFGPNPAVQFSSGGRVATFRIPANSQTAIFANGDSSVKLQTGTVAGSLVVTPAFGTEAGLNLTPSSPEALALTVDRGTPRLLESRITGRTLTGFLLTITGYSTSRSLRQLELQLGARGGSQLTNSRIPVDIQSAAMVWFQSAASEPYGGLFSISVPLSFQGAGDGEDQVAHIQSLSVTVSNELGASNAVSVTLQ